MSLLGFATISIFYARVWKIRKGEQFSYRFSLFPMKLDMYEDDEWKKGENLLGILNYNDQEADVIWAAQLQAG